MTEKAKEVLRRLRQNGNGEKAKKVPVSISMEVHKILEIAKTRFHFRSKSKAAEDLIMCGWEDMMSEEDAVDDDQ
jgi:transcriptional regulator of met regulon